jgi:hypothetical protein
MVYTRTRQGMLFSSPPPASSPSFGTPLETSRNVHRSKSGFSSEKKGLYETQSLYKLTPSGGGGLSTPTVYKEISNDFLTPNQAKKPSSNSKKYGASFLYDDDNDIGCDEPMAAVDKYQTFYSPLTTQNRTRNTPQLDPITPEMMGEAYGGKLAVAQAVNREKASLGKENILSNVQIKRSPVVGGSAVSISARFSQKFVRDEELRLTLLKEARDNLDKIKAEQDRQHQQQVDEERRQAEEERAESERKAEAVRAKQQEEARAKKELEDVRAKQKKDQDDLQAKFENRPNRIREVENLKAQLAGEMTRAGTVEAEGVKGTLVITKPLRQASNAIWSYIESVNNSTGKISEQFNVLSGDENKLAYAMKFVASMFLNKEGIEKPEDVVPVITVVIQVCGFHPRFLGMFLGVLYDFCPYAIPDAAPMKPGMSVFEHRQKMGYRDRKNSEDEVEAETGLEYHKRVRNMMYMFACTLCLLDPSNGIEQGWRWLALWVNTLSKMNPMPEAASTATLCFLQVIGYRLSQRYGIQFLKVIKIIKHSVLPKVIVNGDFVVFHSKLVTLIDGILNNENPLEDINLVLQHKPTDLE